MSGGKSKGGDCDEVIPVGLYAQDEVNQGQR